MTFELTVVGMKYQGFDLFALKKLNLKDGTFLHERNNPHDPNAIAFFCNAKKIGYVQKDQTKDFDQFQKTIKSFSIVPVKVQAGAISLRLIESEQTQNNHYDIGNSSIQSNTRGIYCIEVQKNGIKHYYVGQSQDIPKRIQKHIYDLNKGLHPNNAFQSAWQNKSNVRVKLLEKIREQSSIYQTQILLGERERHWIKQYANKGSSLNLEVGGVERTKASVEDFTNLYNRLIQILDGESSENRKEIKELRKYLSDRFGTDPYTTPKLRDRYFRSMLQSAISSARQNLINNGQTVTVNKIDNLLERNKTLRHHKSLAKTYFEEQSTRRKRFRDDYDWRDLKHETFFKLLEMYSVPLD